MVEVMSGGEVGWSCTGRLGAGSWRGGVGGLRGAVFVVLGASRREREEYWRDGDVCIWWCIFARLMQNDEKIGCFCLTFFCICEIIKTY